LLAHAGEYRTLTALHHQYAISRPTLYELYGRARRSAYLMVLNAQTRVLRAPATAAPVDTEIWVLLL
jgi:hypothetical protein